MTEADLLERTQILVRQARLPSSFGLGETWIIAMAASTSLPALATERYENALDELQGLFRKDVFDFAHEHRSAATRYLLLRVGSPAVAHWLTRRG